MPKKEPSFEKDLEDLERIVLALEEGGLPLDESLKRFETGIKLVRRCEGALSAAEKRIEVLTTNAAGDAVTEPFCPEDREEEEAPRKAAEEAGPEDNVPDEPEEEDELLF